MDLKTHGKALMSIHDEFFTLDKKKKLARINLEFESPSEIFSSVVQSDIPIMSEEFLLWLFNAFDFVPDRYKLDIGIFFSNLEGFTEERLEEIFRKNILLALRIRVQKVHRRNRLAMILCGIGLIFILLSVWLNRIWTDDGTVRKVLLFILDLVATVPFWGALNICLIDGSERRKTVANIRKRFNSISFHRKG